MAVARIQTAPDEIHFPRTGDGWRLALHRYRSRTAASGAPVILCGGYSCNRHFLDFDEEYSLARFLARRGFDAWVLEMRGRGLARPTEACSSPRSWTFDDLVEIDMPTAIGHVRGATGQRVGWVGHSMGGMALYAHLGSSANGIGPVFAGVTIASPVSFPATAWRIVRQAGRVFLDLPWLETIPQRVVVGALWSLFGGSSMIDVGMNHKNVDGEIVTRALRRSLGNVPRVKLRQLAHWALEGVFCSADGTIDYRAGLTRVAVPILAVAGSADRMATPQAVQAALEYLSAPPAAYREFGKDHGDSADYGHVDLIFGRLAPTEVFPVVADWLNRHADDPALAQVEVPGTART